MNKKLFVSIIAMVALVAVLATLLVGCNSFAWTSVGGGEPNADVESNGGYYVKQGKYVYFINGYDTATTIDNTWGTPVKNSIVRAELVNGEYTNFVVVVPKQVYNQNANGGFAIFGEWIYYATPNNDLDKHGHASTTHTDFMRTKIDGSATQLIATINSRSSEYLFTATRILYKTSSTINYIDFSGMKNNGSSASQAGVTGGVLIENVESVMWDMNSEYIYFTETVTGDTSYEFCNTLNSIKVDGTDKKVLADKLTYLAEAEKENYTDFFSTKVYNFKLVDMVLENGGATLFYTKSNYINSQAEGRGLFVNKIAFGGDFNTATEKQISKNSTISAVYGLGYEKGALVTVSSNIYLADSAEGITTDKTPVIGKAVTIQTIVNGVVYYTDSTGGKLYAISLDGKDNEKVVCEAKFNTSWLNLEIINADENNLTFAYFNSDDYNYVYVVNVLSDDEAKMIGIMNDADKEAKEKAEEEANK